MATKITDKDIKKYNEIITGTRKGKKILFTIDDMRACWNEALSGNSKKFKEWLNEHKNLNNIK